MDHEQRQGAALLRFLHLLWLLPHSWTAPEGMTVPLIYFSPDGLEPREPPRAFEVFFAFEALCFVSGGKYYGVMEMITELGKRSTVDGWMANNVRCFIYFYLRQSLEAEITISILQMKKNETQRV